MKGWFKTNVAEITFWVGVWLIVTGWLNTPYWLDFVIGALLISIDDKKAADWINKRVPWLHKQIDGIAEGVEEGVAEARREA